MTDHPLATLAVADPAGEDWHTKAGKAYEAGKPPPALPKFKATKAVGRDVYGRFLQDRDTGIVHDASKAKAACDLDAIANGTWFHFWAEVLQDPTVDVPCPHCLPA